MNQDETSRPDSAQAIRYVPTPLWVDHAPYAAPEQADADAYISNGLCRLLHDTQADLTGPEPAWHCRTAQRVLSRAGAEQAAHVVVEFDPAHEQVDVHFARILRGDECIEHAKPHAFQVFRRETNLEQRILDGRLTASLLIADVRIGDIVEVGFTIRGANPAFGGKYAVWTVFDDFNPWLEFRHRLLRPVDREIFTKPFNDPPEATLSIKNGVEDMRWCLAKAAQREGEEFVAPWLIQIPVLQFSEFGSWDDVARLFAPLYEIDQLPSSLAEEVDQLAGSHEKPAERAAEWLRFVQRELRYFAMSLGDGGFVPRKLETIWTSRFGDCKDAAQLYVAGARRLGLDACATLVSTTFSPVLDGFLPGSNLFNHCIVRLRLNGKTYWLDPTRPVQSGSLDNIYQAHAGWALPLTMDGPGLERMGDNQPLHHLNWEDEVQFGPKKDSPARLHRQIEYYSWAADQLRHRIADEGVAAFGRAMLKDLQSIWPEIVEVEPVAVRDDPAENCFTLTMAYDLPNCWKPAETGRNLAFTFVDTALPGELGLLKVVPRRADIYLGHPRRVTRRTLMLMPRTWAAEGWYRVERASGVSFVDQTSVEGRTIVNTKELVIDAWSAPAAEASAYNGVVTRLNESQLTVWGRQRFGRIGSTAGILGFNPSPWQRFFFVAFVVLIIARLVAFLIK